MDLKDTYNRIAEDWHRDHQSDDWWVGGTDAFCTALRPGAAVLDIGCGTGVKSKYLSDKGFKVVGVDISDKMIGIARSEVPGATFVVGDMRDMSSVPGTYDGLFAQASLLHIPRRDATSVVRGWLGKLNPGGVVYIGVKAVREGEPLEEVKKENAWGYEYERFFSYFKPSEIKALVQDLGLEIIYWDTHQSNSRWIQVVARLN